MKRTELVAKIAQKSHISKREAAQILSLTLELVEESLSAGEKVSLPGFGTFETKARAARKGYNPRTKKEIDVPATTAAVFRPAKRLKDTISAKVPAVTR